MTNDTQSVEVTHPQPDFQSRVHKWILACFGEKIGSDVQERNHRFIEEALELVQANGCTASEAHQLVDYVFGRPVGDPFQEVGGVMNTLAALCTAAGLSMAEAGEAELARVWTKVEKIRAKQAAKPKHSPLPEHPSPYLAGRTDSERLDWFCENCAMARSRWNEDTANVEWCVRDDLWAVSFLAAIDAAMDSAKGAE